MADQNSYPLYPPSKLDERQILQGVYDEAEQRLRTDAVAHVSNVSIAVDLDPSEDGVFIADKDNGNKLKVNPDGSINVSTAEQPSLTNYFEVTGVASGVTQTILSVTVIAAILLQKVDFSGTNIAEYEFFIDGNIEDKQRTYFGNSLNGRFDFNSGIKLEAGQNFQVKVNHNRPSLGDFNARIQYKET